MSVCSFAVTGCSFVASGIGLLAYSLHELVKFQIEKSHLSSRVTTLPPCEPFFSDLDQVSKPYWIVVYIGAAQFATGFGACIAACIRWRCEKYLGYSRAQQLALRSLHR